MRKACVFSLLFFLLSCSGSEDSAVSETPEADPSSPQNESSDQDVETPPQANDQNNTTKEDSSTPNTDDSEEQTTPTGENTSDNNTDTTTDDSDTTENTEPQFQLKSIDINDVLSNEQVYNGFGCNGDNISPELSWENPPEGTKSYAVTVFDPDAPTDNGWWHWVIFDIPADYTQLDRDAGNIDSNLAPLESVQSATSFENELGYGGACPSEGSGDHRYVFTIYALDTESLGLSETATPETVYLFIRNGMIAQSSMTATFSR